ncbi:MAG: hypothetical protein QOD71_539 [Thermoleophilaceae bacterium]|jgi:hypothetical protein|nr:hypothetical protein [Thermoleophilaceae bacterium]
MDLAALLHRLARRWWVVVALAALAVGGAATAAARKPDEHHTTIQFVMRPDVSVSNNDLPGTLDALRSDGPLVQTVIGVLSSRAILRRAASDAEVALSPDYSVKATARPSSTLIDSTLTGPDRAQVDRLAAGYTRAASSYVAAGYPAYVLDRLSTNSGDGGTGPGAVQVVILALLVGSALGVALVAAEVRFEPQLRRFFGPSETGAARSRARADRSTRRRERARTRRAPDSRPKAEPAPERDARPEPEARPEPDARPKRDAPPERNARPRREAGPKPAGTEPERAAAQPERPGAARETSAWLDRVAPPKPRPGAKADVAPESETPPPPDAQPQPDEADAATDPNGSRKTAAWPIRHEDKR